MKKICFITTISSTLKSFVLETAKYLHNQCAYDVTLICDNDTLFAKSLPEYIHYIPVKMARGINFSGFKAIKEFKKIFKREKFDIVQYATPNASYYASTAAKKVKVPVRLYCQWGIRYTGFSGLKRKIFKFLEKKVCKNSTNIFAVSPLNMQFSIEEKLYSSQKAKVIGNGGTIGVDINVYDISKKQNWAKQIRKNLNISDSDFVYGFVGRITIDKGCCELLSAFRKIVQNNKDAKLLIVGPTDINFGIDSQLVDWAKNSNSVIFTGKVDNQMVKEYYASMDVLVHPTYREGFGMVIQEAGALAIPVITTNIPGASEVMQDGKSCVLVPPKDSESLFQAMQTLYDDREKLHQLGNEAYIRTKELYERKIMLNNQKIAYVQLMEENK